MTEETINLKQENQRLIARNAKLKATRNYYKQEAISMQQENMTLRCQLYYNDIHYKETVNRYKNILENIKEVVTLDDINCKISKETQNVCDDVLNIIKEVGNEQF